MTTASRLPCHSAANRGDARAPLALLAALLLIAALWPSTAAAQVAQAWLRYTPIDAYAGLGSSRLQAMGGIEVAVPDDQSLFDPYHYGQNPGALLMARDTSIVRVPMSYADFNDAYYGFSQSAIGRGVGIHSEFRPKPRWGIGLDLDYGSLNASRNDQCPAPDDCRFIRDFDLPIAPEMAPVTENRTFGAGVQTPLMAVTYARTFFKDLSLGARFGIRHEAEDRNIINPYNLNVQSDASEFAGGLYYPLPFFGRIAGISAWAHYVKNTVLGVSESPFNEDEYDWNRPEVGFGGSIYVRKGGWLEGIVDGRHHSFDGEEIARINWAPQFFMNPLPSLNDPDNVFKRKWSAFLSGLRHNEGSTRWLVGLAGKPVHLGLRYAYFREYEWITPNEVVLPTVDPLNVKRQGYRFASGLSLGSEGQGLFAVEARIAREYREDYTNEVPDLSIITYTYHFGAEFPVREGLPLRAGVELLRHDPNHADAAAPLKGIGVTAGAGYYWQKMSSRFDLSYAHYHIHYSPEDPSEEIGSGNHVTLSIQRLF